jgi:hypothetical protein
MSGEALAATRSAICPGDKPRSTRRSALEALGAALREWRGTVLVLRRLPLPGEVETFSRALGRGAQDLSAVNENLEDIAAVLGLIDSFPA